MTGPRSPQKSIFLVVFLHLLGFTMGGPILPMLRSHFGISGAQIGSITSAFPLGMLIAVFVFPALSDRYGRKPMLVIAYLGVGVFFLMQGLAVQMRWAFETFLILRFCSGLFGGASTVVKAYIADMSDRKSLPKLMAYREAAGTMAYIVGPTIGGLLFALSGRHLSAAVCCCGGASLLAAFITAVFLRSDRQVPEAQQPAQPDPPTTSRVTAKKAENKPQSREGWKPLVVTMMFVSFAYNFGQSFFDGFFSVCCVDRFALQPTQVGCMFTLLAMFVCFNASFLYALAVRWVGVVGLAIMGLLGIASSLLILGQATKFRAVVLGMVLYGAGVPAFTPCVPTLLCSIAPPKKRGIVLGVDAFVNALGRISSPVLMGALYGTCAFNGYCGCALVVTAGAAVMAIQGSKLHKRSQL